MRAIAAASLLTLALVALPRAARAQCFELVDVSCPVRSEITVAVGPSTEKLAISIAATATRRIGAYVRLFPGLDPEKPAVENATVVTNSALEYGVTYRVLIPLTVGVGYVKREETTRQFGAIDPFSGRPVLADEATSTRSGPSVFVAWAFAPPKQPIGFALSVSAGAVGSGVALGTTLRFPKGGRTPGVK